MKEIEAALKLGAKLAIKHTQFGFLLRLKWSGEDKVLNVEGPDLESALHYLNDSLK